jgi:LmbE family N-acetylglucosaminyl deacetylase
MKVLLIAPHADDEVLGAGGTLARHSRKKDEVYLCIVTKAYTPDWSKEFIEKRRKEVLEANKILGIKRTYFLDFPTVKLDTVPQKELNDRITNCVRDTAPDIVYVPHRGDLNHDHRFVFDAALVACRPPRAPPRPLAPIDRILCYETPSETDFAAPFRDMAFIPNTYVDIAKTLETKIRALRAFKSEIREFPHPRSAKLLLALARKRGAEAGMKAAEAFMLIRERIV